MYEISLLPERPLLLQDAGVIRLQIQELLMQRHKLFTSEIECPL